MNVERLTEIRQRTEAATPGPWNLITMGRDGDGDDEWGWIMGANKNWRWDDGDGPQSRANADFIAHSRDDIPYLLSEVDRLNELLNASKAGQLTLQKAWEQDKADLTARAEAAEARADAAIADLNHLTHAEARCEICKHYLDEECITCEFEWRGLQAGKGDAPNE